MPIMKQKYVRKPLYVDAVKVTKDNFAEVAAWSQGTIKNADGSEITRINPVKGSQYIAIQVHNPINARQRTAYVGDWILVTQQGFKIYTDTAFLKAFDPVTVTNGVGSTKVAVAKSGIDPASHIKPLLGDVKPYDGPERRVRDVPVAEDRRLTKIEVAEDDFCPVGGRAH